MEDSLTPQRIIEALNAHIVGQQDAKKAVAIALRNRWRRMQADPGIRKEIMPANILLIGATGVGKTEIARRLAQLADAPFVKVEASKFTEVGYVGRDVESMVRDLVEQAVNMLKATRKEECAARAKDLAEEAILDILIPPLKAERREERAMADVGLRPIGFETAPQSDVELNERTREKFRIKLKNGELEERPVELEVTLPPPTMQVMGPVGMDGMDGLQDMLSNMMPRRKKKRSVKISEARELLIEEEVQKMIDMDALTRDAIEKAESSGIIFIDEIDKVASRGGKSGGGGPDVSREGVQRDLLPVVEGTTVTTKYGSIKTDHVLFIAAGAFHVAKPSDLIPELQGRFPIRVELQPLTKADFVRILSEPKAALTKQYAALLASEGYTLTFGQDALEAIAEIAYEVNETVENIGARRLHTILSNLLERILFEVPDGTAEREFHVTAAFVREKLSHVLKVHDLSHYIL